MERGPRGARPGGAGAAAGDAGAGDSLRPQSAARDRRPGAAKPHGGAPVRASGVPRAGTGGHRGRLRHGGRAASGGAEGRRDFPLDGELAHRLHHRRPQGRAAGGRRFQRPAADVPGPLPHGRRRPGDQYAVLRVPRHRPAGLRQDGLSARPGEDGAAGEAGEPRSLPAGRVDLRPAGLPVAPLRRRPGDRGGGLGGRGALRAPGPAVAAGDRRRGPLPGPPGDRATGQRSEPPGERAPGASDGRWPVSCTGPGCECGCCEGVTAVTPYAVFNRPGLPALTWRVGRHSDFKESMLARISALPALRPLTTREDDDLSVALMDAWAAALDVLTFYQERIANEGFLRTATERRSLQELAREIGYEPRPGVAASVWLAFTLEDSPGSPQEVIIPIHTRALSLPKADEAPEPFETAEELRARPAWNALRARTSRRQTLAAADTYYFQGVETGLAPGSRLLVALSDATDLRKVVKVEPDADAGRTKVSLEPVLVEPVKPPAPPVAPGEPYAPTFLTGRQALSGVSAATSLVGHTWRAADFTAFAETR